jgi:hypothetical protein
MKPEAFGRALERARLRAERHVTAFQATYQQIITSAADKASRALVSQAALTASDWQPPPDGTLISGLGVTVALREQQLGAVETVVRLPLAQAGIAWDPEDPLLQAFLEQTEAWSGLSIEQAFQPELRNLITDAFQQGLSVKDAAALIRARFAETAVWQAEMLARSNLNMIGNGGMQIAVTRYNEKAGAAGDRQVETKTWVTAGDAAVRASHRSAAGQVVPVDQSFQVGSSMLSFPGDPGGALAEVLNCRCVALYGESVRPRLAASAAAPKTERTEPVDGIDERIAAGLDALSQAADFAARMAHVEQERDIAARARDAAIGERDDLRRQLAAEREENRALVAAEKTKTLEHIESLTARFADRKPRAVEIVRDESGRAVGYREATE